MKIIKQLSEKQFVIEMDDYDLNKNNTMVIAHDYVRFEDNHGIQTAPEFSDNLYGPYVRCANWISARSVTTLSIRQMQEIIIPYLLKHKFMKPEHLLKSDGTPNYTCGQEFGIIIHDNSELPGKHDIYLYRGDSNYDVMNVVEYEKLFTGMTDADDNKIYEGDNIFNFGSLDYFSGVVIKTKYGYFLKITKSKNESQIGDIVEIGDPKNYIKQG